MKSNKIKILRQAMEMSQTEFGVLFNHTQTCISQWETGVSYPQSPDIKKLMKLAKHFKVDMSLEDIYDWL